MCQGCCCCCCLLFYSFTLSFVCHAFLSSLLSFSPLFFYSLSLLSSLLLCYSPFTFSFLLFFFPPSLLCFQMQRINKQRIKHNSINGVLLSYLLNQSLAFETFRSLQKSLKKNKTLFSTRKRFTKAWRTLGDMMQGQEATTCCRNNLPEEIENARACCVQI